ncbi:protein adenylyltransferase SelO [Litorilituus lipolyticus]|uniref:Protein nucleotidyltransferase YdiU n=1 Tax=Litorilituus lipolyticus TaxID=2491017 RepID=A0A502L8D9_9GAMM|nr:YdiU family protein [Litorilituus lipolyticus]TPH18611.1 YdiU family protein [Litorilituus lipolyticus]
MQISNQYFHLGKAFSQRTSPVPVAKPELLLFNNVLASELAIPFEQYDNETIAQYFSGNQIIKGFTPVAQAYSGHQFGHFNPQLGDGRAHLLGELTDKYGQVRDIQLKGSGITQFSRRGDGRCALGPALREYIMSEAMFALGVPTTRCLAVVATGEQVYRERPYAGAIVTRVAASHIRVGTFQYFAARKDIESLKKLTHFAIERHFPEIFNEQEATPEQLSSEQVLAFFNAVAQKQIPLILSWMRVGFIHGVMNTDNTAISGETIDFGPCAMMNSYDRNTVFSSIDKYGRYAFGEQMTIMMWNMTRFAETLIPLVSDDEEAAVASIQPLLTSLHQKLMRGYMQMMANKIGIKSLHAEDEALITSLIEVLESQSLDYTQTFVNLTDALIDEKNHHELKASLGIWFEQWLTRVKENSSAAHQLMKSNNPRVIPRNHHIEAVLKVSQETGDLSSLHRLLAVLKQPYEQLDDTPHFQDAPKDNDKDYHTFCGT